MEVKKETTKETARGIKGETSTPETGKYIGKPQSANSIIGQPRFSERPSSAYHLKKAPSIE